MNGSRSGRLVWYDVAVPTKQREERKLQEDSQHEVKGDDDPLRQQLTVYLTKFREQSISSNLLLQKGKQGLPTLYAKAKKYSMFTVKRKPNRSFDNPRNGHKLVLEMLPSVRRGHW